MDTPQARLKQACRRLDADEVRAALALGADACAQDQKPLTIIVADNPDGGDALGRKVDILKMLFDSGARKIPDYSPEEGINIFGIEVVLEKSMDRLGDERWDEDAEISVLEAWLDAGNDPNPMVLMDGGMMPFIRSICYMFDEIKQWGANGESQQTDQAAHYMHRLVAVLHVYGCPLDHQTLANSGFEAEDITKTLDLARSEVAKKDALALAAGTMRVGPISSRPMARI